MYERLEQCPSCSHPKFDNYLICKDHTVSGESFALVKCDKCELIFTNPRPEKDSLKKYYQSDSYISHTDKGNSLINVLYKLIRSYTLRKKRKLIQSYQRGGTILDYGCGTGDFLKECNNHGWTTIGIEPDDSARKIAFSKINDVRESSDQLGKEEKFDIITAWHVIEHVSNLRETIKNLRKKLRKGGHLVIALPNANSHDSTIYKDHWAAYDVPRHLYHFTQNSFTLLAKSLKLNLIEIHPMKFDSYYVSLLSEKYQSGKSNLLRAFINGRKSNSNASKTGEYSSLIYILKK